MKFTPVFPTQLHLDAATAVKEYFIGIAAVDTVLVVNSCARGQASPESDLDFAILVKPGTNADEVKEIETSWLSYSTTQQVFLKYKQLNKFAHLHLDLIDGNYIPPISEIGVGPDFFEVEIGNQVCYSAPMDAAGPYFRELQKRWLPYYGEELRSQRLKTAQNACEYDLDHIPYFIKRGLHFQAFDILCKSFQEYLQALFIANRTYPIAYNKWIMEQVVKWLGKPGLYPKFPPILSVSNIESEEINEKARMLRELLDNIPNEIRAS